MNEFKIPQAVGFSDKALNCLLSLRLTPLGNAAGQRYDFMPSYRQAMPGNPTAGKRYNFNSAHYKGSLPNTTQRLIPTETRSLTKKY